MTLKVGIDWDLNGWVELFKADGDADNLFGRKAANAGDLKRATTAGAFGLVSTTTSFDPADQQYYGRGGVSLTVVDTNDRLALGYDGSLYDITGQASGTYTGSLYVKSSASTPRMRLRLISSGGTSINGTAQVMSTSAWTQLTVSGSLPHSSQSIRIELECTSGTAANVSMLGPMIVSGGTAPQYLNCGTDSQYENISAYVMNARWRTGFVRPYQNLVGIGRASLVLNNWDARFSPEAGGALWTPDNVALRDILVRINEDATILWTGYVTEWSPQGRTGGEKRCMVEAEDGRKFLDAEIFPDLQTSATPQTLITHVIDNIETSARVTLTPDYSESGTIDLTSIETETVPYYFDQTPNESEARGQQPASLLEDILLGIQAKFWFTRYGRYKVAGPAEDGGAVAATFNDTAISVDYQWAQNIVNECTVKAYPRLYDAFGTLWRLRESVTVNAGATEIVRAYFTQPGTDTRCGADNTTVVLNNLTYSGASIAATITDIDAMSCEISVVNSSGGSRNMTDARVQGNPLLVRDAISRTRGDGTSLAANGRVSKTIDSRWVAKGKWAKRLAQYIVNRFKDARGEVVSITGNYGADSQFADCYIGRKVRVADTQLGHDENYIVIGEDHRWEPGSDSYNHVVKLYLELADTTTVGTTSV